MITSWIEKYQRRAEERFGRLEALLADMPSPTPTTTRKGRTT